MCKALIFEIQILQLNKHVKNEQNSDLCMILVQFKSKIIGWLKKKYHRDCNSEVCRSRPQDLKAVLELGQNLYLVLFL